MQDNNNSGGNNTGANQPPGGQQSGQSSSPQPTVSADPDRRGNTNTFSDNKGSGTTSGSEKK